MRTDAPGRTDEDVLSRAADENRILLTFDKDFGELAWRAKLPASCGIVSVDLGALPEGAAGALSES